MHPVREKARLKMDRPITTIGGATHEILVENSRESFALDQVTDVLWTVTQRCNLKCAYCEVVPHDGSRPVDPTPSQIDRVLSQLRRLPRLESLILSGGEALLARDIEYVLEQSRSVAPTQYLITNGTTVRQRQRALLRTYRPRTMITLDALDEETNACTRGSKAASDTRTTLEWLLSEGIFTIVILVLTRHNISRVPETISGLYRLGVRNILIQQLHCTSVRMRDSFMAMLPSPRGVTALYHWLEQFHAVHPDLCVDDNEVLFFERRPRERQVKCRPGTAYWPQRLFMCGAGFNFFALKANGDVIPCNAFLDAVAGNIHEEDLDSILLHSSLMQGLRNLRTHRVAVIPGCEGCPENPICDGGCRADVFNLTGEIGDPHPCCPRLPAANVGEHGRTHVRYKNRT